MTRRARRVNGEAAFDANYCWLWRIIVQAETLELLELTRLQCDNSIRSKSAVVYMVGTGLRGRNAAHFAFSVYRPKWKCGAFPEGKFGNDVKSTLHTGNNQPY
ncbi:hypothetical protein DER44DRAFT_753126 [Fusarium oxysporum]|nr:hypothetical protein DER44DRAFT_753126 [Fusarium oxysporum]